ncbi:hypothetical protein F1880_008602 [Penicillium rolfsii]|nr:hypothetical protein F1880_008602 [Penicillium rolfsii]
MKFQLIVGSLASLAVAAMAVPVENITERVVFTGDQLKSMMNVLNKNGKADILAPNQSISCNVVYTLALSTYAFHLVEMICVLLNSVFAGTGPPYTIALTSLDLTGCSFTA